MKIYLLFVSEQIFKNMCRHYEKHRYFPYAIYLNCLPGIAEHNDTHTMHTPSVAYIEVG